MIGHDRIPHACRPGGCQKQAAELKAENAELFEQLDTACNLLAIVGAMKWTMDSEPECRNCCCETVNPDNFGDEANHSADCDIPTVFALRDKIRARMDAEKRAEMAK